MRATTDRETFICLTGEVTVSEVDADGVRLETVDALEGLRARLRALPADGVLVGEDSADEWLAHSESFRREFPGVPVLVFSADRDAAFVERALKTDGTDVVRSTLAGTPPSLIRARLDGITAGSAGTNLPAAERYETILNAAADAIYLLDSEGEIVAVNDSATRLTGFSRDELVGSDGSRYIDQETVERGTDLVEKQLDGEAEVGTVETEIETKEGDRVPCEIRVSVLTVDGEFAGTVGVVRDLSEKLEREQELEKRDELLEQISQTLTEVVWVNDPDKAGVEFVSAGYETIWGRSREGLYDRKHAFLDGIHPEDRERVEAALAETSRDPESYDITYRVVRPDGEVRWVHSEAFGVYDDGTLERTVGIATDITERKERERELQAERDLIESIYEASPVGIAVFDEDGLLTRVNDRTAEILGVDSAALLDASLEEVAVDVCDESGEPMSFAESPVRDIMRTGEPVYGHEILIKRPDGDEVWVSWNGEPILDDDGDVTRIVTTVEDITERKRREEKLGAQRDELAELDRINRIIRDVHDALLGAASRDGIEQTVCESLSASGRYFYALFQQLTPEGNLEPQAWTAEGREYVDRGFPIENATVETSPGARALATGEVQVIRSLREIEGKEDWQEVAVDVGIESLAAIPVVYDGREYGVIGVYATEQGAFSERELGVLEELGGTVGHAIAALESREREETLTRLYEATQDLLVAETKTEVSNVVVETANEVLTPPGVGVFMFDDGRSALSPAAATDELLSYYGGQTVFGPGDVDSTTWQVYTTGEPQCFRDVRSAERLVNPETDARSAYVLPLGEHGVFVVASPEVGGFEQRKRQLVGLLATTTEAALDRVAGQADIRERDRKLAERSDRLARVENMLGLVTAVTRELRTATARTELHEVVCERITESDAYAFAWIGTTSPEGGSLVPDAWAGDGGDYLDSIALGPESDEPAVRTARTGTPTVVDNVTDSLQESAWAPPAIDREFQSVLSVPLRNSATTRGVLTVYSTEPDGFGGEIRGAFAELARAVAYGSSIVETRQALLTGQVTELELRIRGTDTFLNAVAEAVDRQVTYCEMRPTAGDRTRVTFSLSDPPVDAILGLESELVAVDSITWADRSDDHLFTATLSASTVTSTLLGCGAVPRKVVATPDGTRATVHVAETVNVRAILRRIRDSYPDTELVSRRTVDRGDDAGNLRSVLDERLTDRQREVLLTAYESGFFESPRDTTGSELAERLGVSQPTVTHHLREAQRRLFTALFANGASLDN